MVNAASAKLLSADALTRPQTGLKSRARWHSSQESADSNSSTAAVRLRRLNWHYGGKSMKFRPLHDRVVVKRVAEEEKTKGGIIIPDTAKEKPMEGEVVAVGPGARDEKGALIAPDVKAGDRILFGKWSGTEVKLDGVEYLIMKESDIMGILEGSAAIKKAA